MFRRFSFHTPHYFRKHLSLQLEELYLSVALQDLALAAVTLFEPIYLYYLGFDLTMILWYYVIVYALYFFLAPLGGKFVARFGPERSILLSTVMLIAYYTSLVLIQSWPVFFWIAPICFAWQKMWYWTAYHTDFLYTSDQGERGKEYSGLWSTSTLMYILGPILGGLGVAAFGFTGLFMCAMVLILLSNIPLFMHTIAWKPQRFSFRDTLFLPFRRANWLTTIGYFALGEELILLVIWPIFMALAFKNYLSIGGVVALATLVTALVTLYVGKKIDDGQRPAVLGTGGVVASIVWSLRTVLNSTGMVFVSDALGRIVKNMSFVSVTSLSYDRAIRAKNRIAQLVFFEQGFALGKLFIALAIILLSRHYAPFTAAFAMAGLVSLFYLVLSWSDKKSAA